MPRNFSGVMHEWKHGDLHSGSHHGPKVTSQKQAEAIAFSEEKKLNHKPSTHVKRDPLKRAFRSVGGY